VNYYEGLQISGLDGLPDAVTFKRHDVVDILRGIKQSAFPQTVGVGGLLPCAMIAFVDDLLERNPGLL
jgi:hypothetical protein